jgi:hypothetical protein
MYNNREEELRRAYINEQNMREYKKNKSALNRANEIIGKYRKLKKLGNNVLNSGNRLSNVGKQMSNVGSQLQKSSNPYLNQLGSRIGNVGNNTQNFGNNLQTSINNRFGANKPSITAGSQTSTSNLAATPNAPGTVMGVNVMQPAGSQMTASPSGMMGNQMQSSMPIGKGLASSQTTSTLPMGADKLSFMGQGAGQTAGTGAIGTSGAIGGTAGTTAGTTAAGAGTAAGGATAAGAGAGTTAAAGGGAAAGAGGAAAAIPVAGWVIAAAALAKSVYDNYKKQKQSKAMGASQQAASASEQESDQQISEAMQNLEAQRQKNQQNLINGEMNQQSQGESADQQKVAELMNMVQQNQQAQPQAVNTLVPTQPDVTQQLPQQAPQQESGSEQIANLLETAIQNNSQTDNQGTVTGGAAPVSAATTPDANSTTTPDTQQLNGNVSQTVDPNAQQQPQQPPQFGDQVYKTGNGNVSQLFDQIRQGYKDNTENTIGNTYFAPGQQKTFGNRIGEALGTGQRIASNPFVQGLIAGGIDYANNKDFGRSALTGINWAKDKAQADRYYQEVTGKKGRPFLSSYTSEDVNNKRKQDNWQAEQTYKKTKDERDYNYKTEKDKRDHEYKVEKDNRDYELRKNNYDRNYNLNVAKFNYSKSKGGTGGGKNGGKTSGSKTKSVAQQRWEYEQSLNKNLGQYNKFVKDYKKAKDAYEKNSKWWTPDENAKLKAKLDNAKSTYERARKGMIDNFGQDFLSYDEDID